jgi:hypothetical protein
MNHANLSIDYFFAAIFIQFYPVGYFFSQALIKAFLFYSKFRFQKCAISTPIKCQYYAMFTPMLRQLSANTTPCLRQYYIIKYIMYIFNLSIKRLIDKIMVKKSQSNANRTPIECQLNATQIVDSSSQKERWVSSKLCRNVHL